VLAPLVFVLGLGLAAAAADALPSQESLAGNDFRVMSARVDELLLARQKAEGVEPAPLAEDARARHAPGDHLAEHHVAGRL
jgi:hypothetical protein